MRKLDDIDNALQLIEFTREFFGEDSDVMKTVKLNLKRGLTASEIAAEFKKVMEIP